MHSVPKHSFEQRCCYHIQLVSYVEIFLPGAVCLIQYCAVREGSDGVKNGDATIAAALNSSLALAFEKRWVEESGGRKFRGDGVQLSRCFSRDS